MLNSFLPQQTPDVAHPLFGSIVCLLDFFLFLIELCEVVVFCEKGLRGKLELASEIRDCLFQSFHVRNGFLAPFSLPPCPHSSSLLVFPSVIL